MNIQSQKSWFIQKKKIKRIFFTDYESFKQYINFFVYYNFWNGSSFKFTNRSILDARVKSFHGDSHLRLPGLRSEI